MARSKELGTYKDSLEDKRKVLIVAHTYQPPRQFLKLSDSKIPSRANILSEVNEKIYNECYKPVFVHPVLSTADKHKLSDGTAFSIYGVLREWWKGQHPDTFAVLQKKIKLMEDKEYRMLGDCYLHPILPLQTESNQDMLIKIGKLAFEEDFGFSPRGFWFPETAVSSISLKRLFNNGYQFAVLRDNQLTSAYTNPIYISIDDDGKTSGELAIIHCDSELSGSISFQNHITNKVEDFLANPSFINKKNLIWMSDTELYGHHMPFKDQFLYSVTRQDILNERGYELFNIGQTLKRGHKRFTKIVENSSWSCSHNLGRWTGDFWCDCDGISDKNSTYYKQYLRLTLDMLGETIDSRLDNIDFDWREKFIQFFLGTRRSMYYDGDIEEDISRMRKNEGLDILNNEHVLLLFKANLARWTAETSCVWFFGGINRPERDIARVNIDEIFKLFKSADIPI